MSSMFFIHKFILPLAVWGIICLPLVGLLLEAVARMRKPRVPSQTLTVRISCDTTELQATYAALDRVIRTLEAYELEEYNSVVQDAEQVLVEYQARLIDERIRELLQDLPSPGFPEGLPPRIEKLLDEEAQ